MSYALDQKVLVEKSDSEADALTRGAIAKGTLTVDTLDRFATVYRVKSTEPRKLVVETPKLEGFKLADAGERSRQRKRGPLPRPLRRESRRWPDVHRRAGEGRDAAHRALERRRRRARLLCQGARDSTPRRATNWQNSSICAENSPLAERALAATNGQINEVAQDQNRLKSLLQAVSAGSDLQKRYLAKLDQEETQLDNLKAARAAAGKGAR